MATQFIFVALPMGQRGAGNASIAEEMTRFGVKQIKTSAFQHFLESFYKASRVSLTSQSSCACTPWVDFFYMCLLLQLAQNSIPKTPQHQGG